MKRFFIVAVTILLIVFFTFPASGFAGTEGAVSETTAPTTVSPPETTAPTSVTAILDITTSSIQEVTTTTTAAETSLPADTSEPVIVLNGGFVINLKIGETFTDPGAAATDNLDLTVAVITTGTVNTNFAGTYIISYNASDAAGNAAATVTRTVNVTSVAAVVTDKPDYLPADYVIVKGSGWLPGETVKLDFHETLIDLFQQTNSYYAVADSSGNISDLQYLIELRHLGASFVLTATGLTSGLTAQAMFTDATQTFPIFSPYQGAVDFGTQLYITATNADQIYYTTDGTDPKNSSTSVEYKKPIIMDKDFTIKAFATRKDYTDSSTASGVYTIKYYTVTFDKNGGLTEASPRTISGIIIGGTVETLPAPPTKNSYLFNGWNTKIDGTGIAFNETTPVTASIKVYAQWTPLYSVPYSKNSATGGLIPIDSNSYISGSTVKVLGNTGGLFKTNYIFSGWNTQGDGKGTSYAPGQTFVITSNTILFAQWGTGYTLAYNSNGGTGSQSDGSSPYASGSTATVLGAGTMAKTNYVFAGWNTESNGTGTNYSQGAEFIISSNTILYAKWTPVTYTVTYNSNGGDTEASPASKSEITSGENVGTLPVPPTRAGYLFNGWNTLSNGTGSAFTAATVILSNITAYAQWIEAVVKVSDASGIYGGIINLIATISPADSGKTINFTLNGAAVGSAITNEIGVATLTSVNLAGINSGTYPTGVGATYFSSSDSAQLIVSKITPVITWSNPDDITYSTALGSKQLNATASTVGTFVYSPLDGTILNEGSGQSLSVTFIPTDSDNYNSAVKTVLLSVVKANQIITFANPGNKTYGDAAFDLAASSTSGLPVNFSIISGPAALDGASLTITGVGNVVIRASQAGNSNYNAADNIDQTISVGKAIITVTADAKSKVYGESDPELTFTSSDPKAVFTGSLSRDEGESIGDYTINSTLSAGNNYSINYISANLTIKPAQLTVSADAKSKIYGEADPELTYQITSGSLVKGDSFTGSLTRAEGENIGNYAIGQGTLSLSKNYEIKYIDGTLTINPKVLTVTVDNSSKIYGSENPVFTIQYSGFVKGDNPSSLKTQPIIKTDATAISPVGKYTINASGASLSNYKIDYKPGILIINRAVLIISTNNALRLYGETNPVFTVQYSGFVLEDTLSSLTLQPVIKTNATQASPAGIYLINASGASSPNYKIYYKPGILIIDRAILIITANNASRQFGEKNPVFTVQYSGFVLEDTSSSLILQPVLKTTATQTSLAGTYPINASGAFSFNYKIYYKPAILTVTYYWYGFLQPINTADTKSVFKLGSTIPVKFKIDGDVPKKTVAKISFSKIGNISSSFSVNEAVSKGEATTGTLFRYSAANDQYIYNLNTKNLTAGEYTIKAMLDDGKEYSVNILLSAK